MIGPTTRQSSLFYVAFGREASLIKDDLLGSIDDALDDEFLIALVRDQLGKRRPHSKRLGRRGIAPDRLLRLVVLKEIKRWSLREVEREVRCNLVYRRFTRFDHDRIPNYSNISRAINALDPSAVERIHARVVQIAKARSIAPGRRMRTDTTVVETNVHHPTDSALLGDSIRVLQRAMKQIADACESGAVHVVDHTRTAQRRILEIHTAARAFTEASKQKMKTAYGRLLAVTRGVVRRAESLVQTLGNGAVRVVGDVRDARAAAVQIQHFIPLAKRVIAQTKARVFEGNVRFEGKLLSLFETHTVAIRKGKAHKPTEFGRLVRIDEVENGIISNYHVADGNPADATGFVPAVSQHVAIFGRPPQMAAADRGYFSAANEHAAQEAGVAHVVLPGRGPLSASRRAKQKTRWFKRGLKWRAGIEPRIATLKHRFNMNRVSYRGDAGMKRGVGWSIVAQNLVSIARIETKRAQKGRTNGRPECGT